MAQAIYVEVGAVHRAENSDTDRAAELAQRHDERRAGAAALILSDYDYLASWATSLAFEVRTAAQAQTIHVHRWVFAVPHVCYHDGDTIQARAPVHGTLPAQRDRDDQLDELRRRRRGVGRLDRSDQPR
ncbi:hypothetical protein FMEAI12_5000025 [Parafrankia sp. Ea1.12]|uniref:hypothetical protein n=1 Tax=Parafrankia sp. Ea1.12 TaxID=573499 RepID=UPI000DA49E81|nr:hypothetical protein [Parafrankia sp. Ea1.12]SQD98933.1 hypothetical protein FMEAI12_5000025 [Parafrankia sp. Ea1.12]